MIDLKQINEPTECILETCMQAKIPECIKFPCPVMRKARLRVLLNYTKCPETLARVEEGYFRSRWEKDIPNTPLCTNADGSKTYVRFLIQEVMQETFEMNGKEIPYEEVVKYLPKRGTPDSSRPVYMTMELGKLDFQWAE